MFRKFSCGCIGIVVADPANDRTQVWCVIACDGQGYGPVLTRRDGLLLKTSELLSDQETESVLLDMAELIKDGHRLRNLRRAMDVAMQSAPASEQKDK